MKFLPFFLILFTGVIALALLAYVTFWIASVIRSGRWRQMALRAFPRERIRLLKETAAELGAETVDDPRVAGVPYVKSHPPDPPYGLALAPADEEFGAYFPIFEAPLAGAVFLEAWPTGSPYPPLRVNMGGDGVAIGDAEFDSAYIVRADDPFFARSLLGPEARGLIAEGRKLGAGGRLRLNLDPLRLRLRKEEALTSSRDLAALARVGLGLLERVRETAEGRAAVQFFDAPPFSASKPNCPVCSVPVVEGRVSCRRCLTPHHRECWDYARGCSMFACGETRFSL